MADNSRDQIIDIGLHEIMGVVGGVGSCLCGQLEIFQVKWTLIGIGWGRTYCARQCLETKKTHLWKISDCGCCGSQVSLD